MQSPDRCKDPDVEPETNGGGETKGLFVWGSGKVGGLEKWEDRK